MSRVKKTHPSGVITSHTSSPVRLLKLKESVSDAETTETESLSQPNVRTKSSYGSVLAAKKEEKQISKQHPHSHASLRQTKAEIEAEKQKVQELIQPLLDTENSFMKELECFLREQDVQKLRRKELLHKRWTERVWLPFQKRLEEHESSCRSLENQRRQWLYEDYLRHCNSKEFVFLEAYDLQEYNPFLLSIRKSQQLKTFSSRLDTIPDYLRATATSGGRCHQSSCRCTKAIPGLQPNE